MFCCEHHGLLVRLPDYRVGRDGAVDLWIVWSWFAEGLQALSWIIPAVIFAVIGTAMLAVDLFRQ